MARLRIHPGVYDDIAEALETIRELFGRDQVALYAKLIVKARKTLREHPTIGHLREDLGPGVRVFCIAATGRINAPHGYVYRIGDDGIIHVARFVYLARYLPNLPPRT